jgi:hypothetical protein
MPAQDDERALTYSARLGWRTDSVTSLQIHC